MARQAVNLGVLPNGAGGDTTRSANIKINDMTQELYVALGADGSGALPGALPLSKGGTGANSLAGAKAALGISDPIVWGINANGTFVKFPDGTMFCTGTRMSVSVVANVRADFYPTFPADFIQTPTLVPTLEYPSVSDGNGTTVKRFTGTAIGGTQALLQITSGENNTYMVGYIAMGRWK